MVIAVSNLEVLLLSIIVLLFGYAITKRVLFLERYNIPTPVTGGLLASLLIGIMYIVGIELRFSLELRDILLLSFFSTIGLSARIKLLLDGGRLIVILMFFTTLFLIVQNSIGVSGALLFNLDPLIGLLSGSITLSGGHGTGVTYGELFKEHYGLEHGVEIAMACATYGLVAAGLLGGPLARLLINRYKINVGDEHSRHLARYDKHAQLSHEGNDKVRYRGILECILLICICIVVGVRINEFITAYYGVYLPDFVMCLFVGIVIINTLEWSQMYKIKTKSLALCSNLSLDLFLTMSLMSLQLWVLVDLAVPLLIILLIQTVLVLLYAYFVIFRIVGKSYTSTVIAAGYTGFALGATPTAIANMNAITKNFGPSPKAFLVIPLIGAFFIDIANNVVLQLFLRLPIFQ